MTEFDFEKILRKGIESGASDLHLSAGEEPAFRIDGRIERMGYSSIRESYMNEVLKTMMNEKEREKFEKSLEADFAFVMDIDGERRRFRVNLFYEKRRPALALRFIQDEIHSVRELGLPTELETIARSKSGLFLVTGPAGSGKSTTLAAIIREINSTRALHIITIEDPIEYIHTSEKSLIRQREIGRDTKNFAEALRRALRQDPDVIMIGEMRDLETISAAVAAAETGHFVLATLHTKSAAQSIERIIDAFPQTGQQQIRSQLADIIVGVLSQRLIPQIGGGRAAATELMVATYAVRNYIREGKSNLINNVIQTGSALGMHTMSQDIARLVRAGKISREEASKYVEGEESSTLLSER